MLTPDEKRSELARLADKRRRWRIKDKDYLSLHEFHEGFYECNYVSPWSISAHNVDAEIVIVGQDWSSENYLQKPKDETVRRLGYDPKLATNKTLQRLLREHFSMEFADVYATNLFPFIKRGGLSSRIRAKDLDEAAKEFLLPQIVIIRPKIVICLGKETFNAVQRACGHRPSKNLEIAVRSSFDFDNSRIFASAHTGSMGIRNRGRERVGDDWTRIRKYWRAMPSRMKP